ncbi:MAG: hypothetical protein CMI12_01800 [Oceanospirillum sp.]|nr:hypothetical protein [Oceanospirillum sp.]
MKTLISAILICFSSFALATDASWEKSRVGYTIYYSGGYAETPFNDLNVPRYGTSITNVTWDYNELPATNTIVKLCYQKQYSHSNYECIDITGAPQGNSDSFNGLDARGTFQLYMRAFGDNFPIYSTQRLPDTVRVDYNF